MAFYIKVSIQVATKIGAPVQHRNQTADGNILLWQADLNAIPGETIFDRAEYVGGVVMQAVDAKMEIDGIEVPAEVTIPEQFLDPVVDDSVLDGTDDETVGEIVSEHPVTLPAGVENGEYVEPLKQGL